MTSGPLIPFWITAPLAMALMIIISAHAARLGQSEGPPSRRRIRQASAWLSIVTLGLLIAGLSILDPSAHAGEWMLVWIATMAMLTFVIGLALLDVANTLRIALGSRRRLRGRLRSSLAGARRPGTEDAGHERA